jgi:hypothetical protein
VVGGGENGGKVVHQRSRPVKYDVANGHDASFTNWRQRRAEGQGRFATR